ncbi:MAG: formylglycine-generating enzyme family protein [Planctomycetes bacterium]|nr:formylglycine-generating enzyme family protein [Planctomycetota bacterium]MCH9724665.1 formylglycine-generating enzyme family protein [Planctomycetota bacterium]MCH9774816.1 formylglycine-generating enzyme family protein [Planctomycetota bacterium]MCH9793202.1 formylglycine-generating enzyme family protein [Planctomycetota bacterium]
MKSSWRTFYLLAGGLLFLVVGCGGNEQIANKQTLRQKRSSSSSSDSVPKLKSSGPKSQTKSRGKKKQPILEGKPENFFEVVDYIHNYQIRKPGPDSEADEQYAVLLPAQKGIDSSTFSVIKSVSQGDQGTPDSTFELPKGFSAIDDAGYSAQGLPNRIRCDRDYSEMVLVPAGVSIQGEENGAKNASPQFAIYQNTFYIDVHEVTLEQYRRWRSEMIAQKGKLPEPAGNDRQPAEFPAMGISYTDALNYARTMGKQLPRETQWEKAARGESGFVYPWGNGRALWHKTRMPGQIDPVGSFSGDRSPYGVFDLSGNAREWCDDWYSDNSYQAATALADAGVVRGWEGPKRSVIPSMRVVRGNQKSWDVRKRIGENMRTPPADVGFRCVLNLPKSKDESDTPEKSNNKKAF